MIPHTGRFFCGENQIFEILMGTDNFLYFGNLFRQKWTITHTGMFFLEHTHFGEFLMGTGFHFFGGAFFRQRRMIPHPGIFFVEEIRFLKLRWVLKWFFLSWKPFLDDPTPWEFFLGGNSDM